MTTTRPVTLRMRSTALTNASPVRAFRPTMAAASMSKVCCARRKALARSKGEADRVVGRILLILSALTHSVASIDR